MGDLHKPSNVHLLTIRKIAAWVLPHQHDLPRPKPLAVLPKLQRSPAWKPEQTERLWDSLVRGFPVGSIMVSPFGRRAELGQKGFALQQKGQEGLPWVTAPDDWHLLDGQQRCNAIALGLFNPWENDAHRLPDGPPYTLWVDLLPADGKDERRFIFRLLTRSHPWGYQRSSPKAVLSAGNRRDAADEFERARGHALRSGQLPVEAIPFDAKAPVPLAVLIGCLEEANIWQALRQKVAPLWPSNLNPAKTPKLAAQWEAVDAALSNAPESQHLAGLLHGVRTLLSIGDEKFRIAALVLASEDLSHAPVVDAAKQSEDPIATLFIRINSAGTVPSQEEMAYSLLKSECPECHELVEELSHAFLPPSLMVAQFSSLVLAGAPENKEALKPPAFPDLASFRRLMHNRDFLGKLKNLVSGRAREVVSAAVRLILLDGSEDRQFRLLPAQAAGLARRRRRVFFLLLCWIDGHADLHDQWLGLDEAAHRRLLGTITALGWFSWYEEDCVALLWPHRHCIDRPGVLGRVVGLRKKRFALLPLPPPNLMRAAVAKRVVEVLASPEAWRDWKFWSDFAKDPRDITAVANWYSAVGHVSADIVDGDATAAWSHFVNRLRTEDELLVYTQRVTLHGWFSEYNPTLRELNEDLDRPWDFDHILPNVFRSAHRVPQAIRDWQSSIGNLRAWPAELNRSDQAIKPVAKLRDPTPLADAREITVYKLRSQQDRLVASNVTDGELELWCEACPGEVASSYLAAPASHQKRLMVVSAISQRWIRIYAAWFQELLIGELTDPSPDL